MPTDCCACKQLHLELRVQTLGTKALNKEFIRTPKLTCSRVTKTNYNLHGNQSKLSLFCEISIQDFKTSALFLGQKTLSNLQFLLNVCLSKPKVHMKPLTRFTSPLNGIQTTAYMKTSAPPSYLQNNFFVTHFQTILMIPGNINFSKKTA